jgi:putative transposase
LYGRLARREAEQLAGYRALFKAPMDRHVMEAIRDCTNKVWALGGGRFEAKIERLTARRTTPLPKGRQKC